jgi:GLPGLI family protein
MKKTRIKFSFLFFLLPYFIVCYSYAQLPNQLTYGIELNKIKKNNTERDYVNLISDLDLKLKKVTFNLNFNDSIARFSVNSNSLSKDDNQIILDIADIIGSEYYNYSKNSISYVNNLKYNDFKDFQVYSLIYTDWIITSERKIINGYECIKANSTLIKDYADGIKTSLYDLTAWFCPKIPVSFGPKSYKGLPGIILELEQNLIVFKALNICHRDQMEKIILPNKDIIPEFKIYEP